MSTAHELPAAVRRLPGPGRFIPAADLRALRESPLAALLRVGSVYGDLVQYPVGFWTIYVVNNPDYVKHVLVDNHANYSKATFQYRLLGLAAGQGLLSNDGAAWLRQRRLAQPAFHRERLAALGPIVTDAVRSMLDGWATPAARSEAIDVDAAMMRLTIEIVGKALFSIDLSQTADVLAKAVLETLDYVVYRARMPLAPPLRVPTPANRRFRSALRTLDTAVLALIAERRRAGGDAGDLLAMLLQARDADTGEAMSDRQVRDEVITFIIAGHETVASALTWTWKLLADHPAAVTELERELATVLDGRPPSLADLPALPWTRMVVDEALRHYPPAWIITRRALAADSIDGYRLPAGALIVISPYLLHRHPAVWSMPETFDPNRFAAEAVAARPRLAYIPFGGGPRLCIGQQFALIESQLVVATVAQRYRLHLSPGQAVEVEPLVTLRPKHGLPMTLEPVSS